MATSPFGFMVLLGSYSLVLVTFKAHKFSLSIDIHKAVQTVLTYLRVCLCHNRKANPCAMTLLLQNRLSLRELLTYMLASLFLKTDDSSMR